MLIIPRYILREHLGPFLFSLITIIFLFLSNYLMQNLSRFVNKGLKIDILFELMFYNLAWILALAVPMAVLVAALMTFGRLSQDNEMIALRTSGISIYKIIFPVFVMSLVLTGLMVQFNNRVLPEFNHRARMLLMDITQKKPTFNLEEGEFTAGDEIAYYRILVNKIDKNSPWVHGVTIFDNKNPKVQRTIIAEKARMNISYVNGEIEMMLYNGEIHDLDINDLAQYRKMVFDSNRVVIEVPNMQLIRSKKGYRGEREKSTRAMLADIDSGSVQIAALKRDYRSNLRVQFEKRYKRILSVKKLRLKDEILDETPPGRKMKDMLDYPYSRTAVSRSRRVSSTLFYMSSNMIERIRSRYGTNRSLLTEVHKKYSIPTMCIVFILLGAPLGIISRRGDISVGGSIGLVFFIINWALLLGGEELADRGLVAPAVAMWTPNIVVGTVGIILMIMIGRENKTIDFGAAGIFLHKLFKKIGGGK